MPKTIDPETIYVDDLPGIWSPVQWELSEQERAKELEEQSHCQLAVGARYSPDLPPPAVERNRHRTRIWPTVGVRPGGTGLLGKGSGHLSIQASHPSGTGRARKGLSLDRI